MRGVHDNADVNTDGTVDTADIMAVMNLMAQQSASNATGTAAITANAITAVNGGDNVDVVINLDYQTANNVVGASFTLYLPDGLLLKGFDTPEAQAAGKASALKKACDLGEDGVWAEKCYSSMFWDCTGLTTVPANFLPATTLAQSCYSYMFSECSNLTAAPNLPAPALVNDCYGRMYTNCSKLASIKCLALSGFTYENLEQWVVGVAETGTFYARSSANWTVDANNGNPKDIGRA